MNQNIELALLTKVIDTRDFHALEKAKIDETYFFNHEAIEVYKWMRDTYRNPSTSGCVPSREMIAMNFPSFPFFNSNDDIPLLAEQLRLGKIAVETELLAEDMLEKVRTNPLEALASLRAEAPRLSALAERSEDYSMASAYQMLRNSYETVANAGGVIGIPYPWQVLNEALQGMKPENFILIYGRPKSMKTWIALKMAEHAYTHARRRVLFYSREMSPEDILRRAASILARVDYSDFLNGRLQPELREHVWTILQELIEDEKSAGARNGTRNPFFVVVSDREAQNGGGVSWLQAKIEEYDPDIAFVDGMYLMKDDRTKSRAIDWKNITHISQDIKGTARSFGIPIVGITQANRGAENKAGDDMTEIAFADAFGQDTDAVYRVKKHIHLDGQTKQKVTDLLITSPGAREGQFDGMVVRASPGHTFDCIKVLTGLDPNEKEAYAEPSAGSAEKRGPPRLTKPSPFLRSGVARDPHMRRVPG